MSTFPGFDRPLNEYKVSELKVFLRGRSLKVGGLKKELVKRLTDALVKEQAELRDANDSHESDDESVIEEDPPSKSQQNGARTDEQPSNAEDATDDKSKDNTKDSNESNDDNTNGKAQPSTEAITSTVNDKNDDKDDKDREAITIKKGDTLVKDQDISSLSVTNINNKKETTDNEQADEQNTDNKQPQATGATVETRKESVPTASKDEEPEARDTQLAAMRAQLLREKLLKQQKSTTSTANTSSMESATPTSCKKRTVRDFEEDTIETPVQDHKRRKLNEKNLEITTKLSPKVSAVQTKTESPKVATSPKAATSPKVTTPGGRIVVDSHSNESNRKLYVPPHQRTEEEVAEQSRSLNDTTHDISCTEDEASALFIDGFRRPLQTKKVEQELMKYGTVKGFRMNGIKSHCYVIFASNESADKCKDSMDDMYFPPNIPQIHAGKLKAKSVRTVEAMKFIQGEDRSRKTHSRSFDTTNAMRSLETLEPRTEHIHAERLEHVRHKRREMTPDRDRERERDRERDRDREREKEREKERESPREREKEKERENERGNIPTPKELFQMTDASPNLFWQEASEEAKEKNKQLLEESICREKELYFELKTGKKVVKKAVEKEVIQKDIEEEEEDDKEEKDDAQPEEVKEEKADKEEEKESDKREDKKKKNSHSRSRSRSLSKSPHNGHLKGRKSSRERRNDYRHHDDRRRRRGNYERRDYDRYERRGRRERDRGRERRERRYRNRDRSRNKRKHHREESVSDSDRSRTTGSESDRSRSRKRSASRSTSRSRSRSRSGSRTTVTSSSSYNDKNKKKDTIPTTTTTTISTLESSRDKEDFTGLHPERMNRIES